MEHLADGKSVATEYVFVRGDYVFRRNFGSACNLGVEFPFGDFCADCPAFGVAAR
jgi:hypothetical protein